PSASTATSATRRWAWSAASVPTATVTRSTRRCAACRRRPERLSATPVFHERPSMDLRKLKKLIELLEESNLAEIEIKEGEESVRLSRGSSAAAPMVYAQAPVAQGGHRETVMPMLSPVDASTGGRPATEPAASGLPD